MYFTWPPRAIQPYLWSAARDHGRECGGGTINLFECLRTSALTPVVVVACSSAEYGMVAADDLPVREKHRCAPFILMGSAKSRKTCWLRNTTFCMRSLRRICIFNTTGPGKIGDVCSDLTRRAVEIELGIHPPSLRVGNLTSRRAIIHVRDIVTALRLSAEYCRHGEVYNVGATQTYSVEDLIHAIGSQVKVPFQIEQDRALMRGCDEPVIAGNITRFQRCTGWSPEIDLAGTLQDMLNWWRSRLTAVPTLSSLHAW